MNDEHNLFEIGADDRLVDALASRSAVDVDDALVADFVAWTQHVDRVSALGESDGDVADLRKTSEATTVSTASQRGGRAGAYRRGQKRTLSGATAAAATGLALSLAGVSAAITGHPIFSSPFDSLSSEVAARASDVPAARATDTPRVGIPSASSRQLQAAGDGSSDLQTPDKVSTWVPAQTESAQGQANSTRVPPSGRISESGQAPVALGTRGASGGVTSSEASEHGASVNSSVPRSIAAPLSSSSTSAIERVLLQAQSAHETQQVAERSRRSGATSNVQRPDAVHTQAGGEPSATKSAKTKTTNTHKPAKTTNTHKPTKTTATRKPTGSASSTPRTRPQIAVEYSSNSGFAPWYSWSESIVRESPAIAPSEPAQVAPSVEQDVQEQTTSPSSPPSTSSSQPSSSSSRPSFSANRNSTVPKASKRTGLTSTSNKTKAAKPSTQSSANSTKDSKVTSAKSSVPSTSSEDDSQGESQD